MTSKERVFAALERREPDRVPMLEWSVAAKVHDRLLPGGSYYDFIEWIGYDAVAPRFGHYYSQGVDWVDEEKRIFVDSWGVRRVDTGEDIPYPIEGPIKQPADLDSYPPPDPHADGVLAPLLEMVARFKDTKAIVYITRDAFINPSYLRGLENLLIDFIENPDLAHRLARMSIDYNKVVAQRAVEAGAEIVMLGDDYAWRRGPVMSPAQFREFVYPYLEELVQHIHECGAYVVKHSDGNLWPLLDMIVDTGIDGINPLEPIADMDIGDTLQLSGPGTVEVHAWAESILPIHSLQIVQGGRVVAQLDARSDASAAAATEARSGCRLELREKVRVDRHSWLAARVGGPDYSTVPHHDGWKRGIFAHTSPVYVAVGGEWWMFDRAAAEYMLTLFDGCLTYVRDTAPVRRDAETTFHHGEEYHLAYLERPFHQAREALHRRMHRLGIEH